MSKYKVEVDLMLCQGHGVCVEECPEVFEVVDMDSGYPKVRVKAEYPDEGLRSKVEDAVRFCPNQTIQLIEVG
jgi:ferredoxin